MTQSTRTTHAGNITARGELCCGNPNCPGRKSPDDPGKVIGMSDKNGHTTLRCSACKEDSFFSIPLMLARAFENYTLAQLEAARTFQLIASVAGLTATA